MKIPRFVLTGGPGAGKTESRLFLKEALEKKGYHLIFVPESATELITGGLSSADLSSEQAYQTLQLLLQKEKEDIFFDGASRICARHPVIICDRGMLDGAAWSDPEEFDQALQSIGETRSSVLQRYDAVFHMESAALGDPETYVTENNEARTANAAKAAQQDLQLQQIWKDHPCRRLIPAQKDSQKKMETLCGEVLQEIARIEANGSKTL